jgi:hypothetical protein
MAKSTIAASPSVLQFPEVKNHNDTVDIPDSFSDALRDGWELDGEITTLAVDKRHRHGTAILHREGCSVKLRVPYTASVKTGYQFGKPEIA